MAVFYTPELKATSSSVFLEEQESRHLSRVLRKKVGNRVTLINGQGIRASGVLKHIAKSSVEVQVEEILQEAESPKYHCHLAVSPTKNIDRMEWFLEKATEVGLHEFTPILTHHSERRSLKLERLQKIAISAIKQSNQLFIPKINPLVSFREFLEASLARQQERYIAHCSDGSKASILTELTPASSYLILIGPEGDFSDMEIKGALQAGFEPITLGESRLRTETAALASVIECAIANR